MDGMGTTRRWRRFSRRVAENRAVRLSVAVLIALTCGFAPAAFGRHVHRVNGWSHGLGDGANDNSYVHPFITGHGDAEKGIAIYRDRTGRDYLRGTTCDCGHVHLYQDTSPHSECLYYMSSSRSYWHTHYHHYFCGS